MSGPEVLGARLRQARLDRRLSLHEVEERSNGAIKATTLSAYELGDSNIPAVRLGQLADVYELSVDTLLASAEPNAAAPAEPAVAQPAANKVHLDLIQLERAKGKDRDVEMVSQLVDSIQSRRGARPNRYFAMRSDDLSTAAAVIGRPVEAVLAALQSEGVLRRPRGRPLGRSK